MTIGGIGLGLFILLITWLIAIVIFVIGIKLQNNVSWIALGLATIFTIILLCIPTKKETEEIKLQFEEKDYTIIYKNLIVIFLFLSTLAAFFVFFIGYCIEPVRPKYFKSFHET